MRKILLFCLSLGFLITTTSCLKKQNLEDDNLGPVVAPAELTQALGDSVGSFSYSDIKTNEKVSVRISQRFQDGIAQNTKLQEIVVTKITTTAEKISLNLDVNTDTYFQPPTHTNKPWTVDINLSRSSLKPLLKIGTLATDEEDPDKPIFMSDFLIEAVIYYCKDSGKYPETCHNLISEDIQYKVPYNAGLQHKCADPANCYIPAKRIQFDRLIKGQVDKDGKPWRLHHTFIVSQQTPFLSRTLQSCTRGLFSVSDSEQKVLADLCYSVNDYSFGQ